MGIQAIIFDMDGLMIDSERLYFQTEREIAAIFQKPVKEQILWKMMGRKPIESMEIFVRELHIPQSAEKILELRDRRMKEKLETDLVPMPGLFEIIHFFSKRLKLAISTGAEKKFLDIVLNSLGIRDEFSVLQTSDDIKYGKPEPETYLKTCEKLGLDPANCVVLEDSSNGVKAGKKAGCYVIAVPSEYTRDQDFSLADFIAGNLLIAKKHINSLIKKIKKPEI